MQNFLIYEVRIVNRRCSRGCCMDYGKPLVISTGNDSFASIDPAFSTMRPTSVVEKIKQAYMVKFPHDTKDEDCSINEDPAGDPNFNETAIDSLRLQRDEVSCHNFFLA